jgi:hypothetical protein
MVGDSVGASKGVMFSSWWLISASACDLTCVLQQIIDNHISYVDHRIATMSWTQRCMMKYGAKVIVEYYGL